MSVEVCGRYFRGIEKIDTALDSRGFVDPVETIAELMSLIDSYDLTPDPTKNRKDMHHCYWPASRYKETNNDHNTTTATEFRGLRINQIHLPRNIHDLLHQFTIPPPIPGIEFMHDYIVSSAYLMQIFKNARSIVVTQRKIERIINSSKKGNENEPKYKLSKKLGGIVIALNVVIEKYSQLPEDSRVMPELDLCSSPHDLATNIGRFVGSRVRIIA